MPKQHLLSPQGLAAIDNVMGMAPLLAFDFDGTLAPIVPHPDDARVPPGVASQLADLALMLPTAIVTGRSVSDVTPRLGFRPRHVIGNHGAEEIDGQVMVGPEAQLALAGLRKRLTAHALPLARAEVMVEDKRHSLALHYRLASHQGEAIAAIEAALHPLDARLRTFGGKLVVNVVAASAPDKGDAVCDLVRRLNTGSAVFIGDDVNDEAVFARARPHWVTARVGREDPTSAAHFYLNDPSEVGAVLGRMQLALARNR